MSGLSAMSLSHLKFRHLMLVLHLVEFGNLHKAARHLSISQPAASAMLIDLESLLGLTLFLRNRQGVAPTEHALALVGGAKTMVNEFTNFIGVVENLGQGRQPVLRVGVVPQAFVSYLPTAIARYRADGGGNIKTHEGTARQLITLLYDGMLDCMVGRLSSVGIPEERDIADLAFSPLYEEQICVVEGTGAKANAKATYASLAQREWVLQRRDSSVRRELAEAFLRRGLMLPEPIVETTNYIQSLAVVGRSNYCTVAPRRAAEMHVDLGTVRILKLQLEVTPMPVSFIYKRVSNENVSLMNFRDSFISAAALMARPSHPAKKPISTN